VPDRDPLLGHRQGRVQAPLRRAALALLLTAVVASSAQAEEDRDAEGARLVDAAMTAYRSGDTALAESLFRQCRDVRRKTLGPTEPRTLRCTNNLGAMLTDLDRAVEAEPLLREALAGRRALKPAAPDAVRASLALLAGNLRAQKRLAEAEPLLREALAGAPPEHRAAAAQDLARVLFDLHRDEEAAALWRANLTADESETDLAKAGLSDLGDRAEEAGIEAVNKGDTATARSAFTACETLRADALGPDAALTQLCVRNLGVVLRDAGDLPAAIAARRRLVDSKRRSHPEDLDQALIDLATVLDQAGRPLDSIPVWREALTLRATRDGDAVQGTVQLRFSLGRALTSASQWPEAIAVLQSAAEGWAALQGEGGAEALDARGRVASALSEAGRLDEAEQASRRLLDITQRTLGKESLEASGAQLNLARLLADRGKLEEAERLNLISLEGLVRLQGETGPDALSAAANRAYLLIDTDRFQDAEVLAERLRPLSATHLGADHPVTLIFDNVRSNLASARGEFAEAERLDRATLAGWTRRAGPNARETLLARYNLAIDLSRAGRNAEAADMLQEIAAYRATTLGDDHPDVLRARAELASTLIDLNRHAEAEALLADVNARRLRVLGADHPATLNGVANRAVALRGLDRMTEAVALDREVLAARRRILGADNLFTLLSQGNLGVDLLISGQDSEGAEVLTDLQTRYTSLAVRDRAAALSIDRARTLGVLSLARLRLDRPDQGYPAAASGVAILQSRAADRRATADAAGARREQAGFRWVFVAQVRNGWSLAHSE
jgi:hypothetical protein